MRRLNKLLQLSGQQHRVLLYACLSLNSLRLALWLFPFKVVRPYLERISAKWVCDRTKNAISVDFIVWSVNVAGYYTPRRAKCLVKALITQLLLTRYGYTHQLHIGVTVGATQTLEAHAWVECDDRIVIGDLKDLSRFKPLSNLGTSL